ncbi:MAG: hypothetical protein ACOC6F_03845, partial [bacterium]
DSFRDTVSLAHLARKAYFSATLLGDQRGPEPVACREKLGRGLRNCQGDRSCFLLCKLAPNVRVRDRSIANAVRGLRQGYRVVAWFHRRADGSLV